MQTAKMSAIFHFLGENVTGIAFTSNVEDLDNLVLNPLTDFGFAKFEMANPFGSKVTSPVNHSFVVVVKYGGAINVGKRNTNLDKSLGKISDTNSKFAALVSRTDFRFTRAHGCFVLTNTLPSQQAFHAEDHSATHAAELE